MIEKNSTEYNLWKEIYLLRNKYYGLESNDENGFAGMRNECEELYKKYEKTKAEIPARWACQMLMEIFNEEVVSEGGLGLWSQKK